MRAAVYLRQSLDRTGEGLAVARQREDCYRLCTDRGWEPVEYEDNDTSATSGIRKSYERMLRDIEAGKIKAVVAWDLDRLHRRPIELERFMELADAKKLALATVTGDVDLSTDNGRLFARIKGAVARAEVERKSARQKRAAKQSAESGHGWGGRRAFGYNRDGTHREPEASILRDAYTGILSGLSLRSIASDWNSLGAKTTAGNDWTGSTVRQTLVNPRNAGRRFYLGEDVAQAQWEPIVAPDIWSGVEALLTAPNRRAGTNARKRLLTGILVCARCDETMGSGVSNGGDPTYVCKNCLRNSRRLAPVDRLVIKVAKGYLASPEARELLRHDQCENTDELHGEEVGLLTRLKQLPLDYADGNLTALEVRVARERIEGRLSDIRDQLLSPDNAIFDGLVGQDFEWDDLHLDRQRSIIRRLFIPVLAPAGRGRPFKPDHLAIRWRTQE
jgi:DNA invertase Pin-like site-specific DNA recombinase